MLRETELFFREVMVQDRSVLDFLDADYTFVNERLARHYGMPGVQGDSFARLHCRIDRRGGLLTQASILTLTSNPTRTSPVKRGKWILENMLGAPPPPPPPGVVATVGGSSRLNCSGRCASAWSSTAAIRPVRFATRKWTPSVSVLRTSMRIGAWRERDGQFAIDPSGELPGDQRFTGPRELRQILKTTRRGRVPALLGRKNAHLCDRTRVRILRPIHGRSDREANGVETNIASPRWCWPSWTARHFCCEVFEEKTE